MASAEAATATRFLYRVFPVYRVGGGDTSGSGRPGVAPDFGPFLRRDAFRSGWGWPSVNRENECEPMKRIRPAGFMSGRHAEIADWLRRGRSFASHCGTMPAGSIAVDSGLVH